MQDALMLRAESKAEQSLPRELSLLSNLTINRFRVPTKVALNHSLCVIRKTPWDFYHPLGYSTNQGTTSGDAVLSKRRRSGWEKPETLYVVKREKKGIGKEIASVAKPIHNNIVQLYQIFCHSNTVAYVYEAMEVSLEEVFSLDVDPWSINPGFKDSQLAAICLQVLKGLQYLHHSVKVSYGLLSTANVLVNRNGAVKLANAAYCVMHPRQDFAGDLAALARMLLALSFPLEIRANCNQLERIPREFFHRLVNDDIRLALRHEYLQQANAGQLAKLVLHTLDSTSYPLRPFQESSSSLDASQNDD